MNKIMFFVILLSPYFLNSEAISEPECEDILFGTRTEYCKKMLQTGNEFVLLAIERSKDMDNAKILDNALLCADIAFSSLL